MSSKNLRLQSYVCGVLAVAALSGAAQAAEETRSTTLEEIVVTAERRSESLQDVSLSITAFGDEKRDIVGIQSIQDMANFAPGVSYNTSTDRPSIRGIARQSNFFTIDSPVANYFDGVYTSSVQDAQRRPIFIERTEILRGPQGALSGRGSIAGAINTISKRPLDAFGAEVRAFGGNYSRYGGETTVTGPVTDWWRVRVNLGTYHQNEGYFENIATKHHEGDQPNNRNIQDYLMDFDIGESIDLFVKASFADYDESRRTGFTTAPYVAGVLNNPTAYGPSSNTLTPLASYGYFPAANASRLGGESQNPVITTGDERKFSNDFPSRQKLDDHHNIMADLVWHLTDLDLRWISGHQNYKYTQLTDVDLTDVLTMRLPSPAPGLLPARVVMPGGTNLYMEERMWYSNELTITSKGDGSFSWIGGVYHSHEKFNQEPATTTFKGYAELNDPILFAPGAVFTVRNPVPFTSVRGLIDGVTDSRAVFGQADYKFSDQWKLTAGLRYNRDDKDASEALRYIANGLGNGTGPILAGGGLNGPAGFRPYALDVTPVPVAGARLPPGVVLDRGINPTTGYRERVFQHTWDALTGSAGLDFKPTGDDLAYLRVAKGYRPGGFNAGFLYDPPMVDEESVISYEIGYKTTLYNQLQLSASAFYYDYKDIQLPLPTLGRCTDPNDLSTCTILSSFINLPKAKSQGIELEANWAPTDSLNFYLTYGFLDAKITDALAPGSQGYQNPDDPAAVLRNAKRLNPILTVSTTPCTAGNAFGCSPGTGGVAGGVGVAGSRNIVQSVDTDFTFLPRYTQDLTGNPLANSARHHAAFNTNYTFSFAPGKLTASASYVYRSSAYSDVFATEESKVPQSHTVGARLLWVDADGRYTFILYGTNLTNELAVDGASATRIRTGVATSTANASVLGQAHYQNLNLAPPREVGLEVQYRFGSVVK